MNKKSIIYMVGEKINAIAGKRGILFLTCVIYTTTLFSNYLMKFILHGVEINLLLPAIFYVGINVMALIFIRKGKIEIGALAIVSLFTLNLINKITNANTYLQISFNTILSLLVDVFYLTILTLSLLNKLNKKLLVISNVIFVLYTVYLLVSNVVFIFAESKNGVSVFQNILNLFFISSELSLIAIANIKAEDKNSETIYNLFRVILVVLLIVCSIRFINTCDSCLNKDNSDPNDGKCDICGESALVDYAGHEM